MKQRLIYRISILIFCFGLYLPMHAQDLPGLQDSVRIVPRDSLEAEEYVGDEEEYDQYAQPLSDFGADSSILRAVPDSIVSSLRADKEFDYANNPDYWKKDPPSSPGFWDGFARVLASPFTKALFYLALGALAIFVIYRIIVMNQLFLFSSYRKDAGEPVAIDESDLSREALEENWRAAKSNGDFRLAIRYLFLLTLQSLREKGHIQYHPEATNQEYVNQLSSTKFGRDFRVLNRAYEYAWYGEVDINSSQFDNAEKYFLQFIKQVR